MDYVLAGATGLVGTEVLRQLAKDAQNRVFCLGRRAPEISGPSVHFVEWDFERPIQWPREKPKTPHAICTLGTTIKKAGSQEAFRRVDLEFVLQFAREMQKIGAQSLHVVTAHGASASSVIFYNRVKGEVEHQLSQLGLPALHIYRPSLLLGHRREHRAGEGAATVMAKLLGPVFKLPGLSHVEPTPADRLAQFILRQCNGAAAGKHIHSNYEILHR
jgi:uncharacterized protein YbjT (DUF2867 family)